MTRSSGSPWTLGCNRSWDLLRNQNEARRFRPPRSAPHPTTPLLLLFLPALICQRPTHAQPRCEQHCDESPHQKDGVMRVKTQARVDWFWTSVETFDNRNSTCPACVQWL